MGEGNDNAICLDWYGLLDDRQRKELALARIYAQQFHHGTTGHNQLMLIALMADMMDSYVEFIKAQEAKE
jgi:hypothetical protein